MSDLHTKLSDIDSVLDVDAIASVQVDEGYIQKYYRVNKLAYTLFHSSSGSMHMGISRDGAYKVSDLHGQVEIVGKYIAKDDAHKVLELACGRGANSLYLAEQFSSVTVTGVDISRVQLSYAYKHSRSVTNAHFIHGNFHDLSAVADESLDIVFVVEALCHSDQKEKVFAEVLRVLKTDGHFIVFDGYRAKETVNEDEQVAATIVAKGMALSDLALYSSFREQASAYFTVSAEEDLSEYVVPTMERFERTARRFFSRPKFARLLARILPTVFTYNAAVGYLLPQLTKTDVFCYMCTVFTKR